MARHDARGESAEAEHLVHPEVDDLELATQTLGVRSVPGQELVVQHAEPGSPTARRCSAA